MEKMKNFSGETILPEDVAYAATKDTFAATGVPAIILKPKTAQDVGSAIAFAKENNLAISVRSGGHSVVGFGTNNGGAVIDLSLFNEVELIDKNKHLVCIGVGARWFEAAKKLQEYGLALSSGDTKTVGVGGLTQGGGIGWMVRKFGLTIDSLVAAEIVTADGSVLRASETENPDLFWAIRGGCGNFGIVTNFEFIAHPVGKVYSGAIIFKLDNLEKILKGWRDNVRSAPEELTTIMNILPNFAGNPPMIALTVCYAGADKDAAMKAIGPLLALDAPLTQTIKEKEYYEVLEEAHPPKGMKIIVQSTFIDKFDDDVIAAVLAAFKAKPDMVLQVRAIGGAMNRVPVDATAFAHRTSEVMLLSPTFLPPDASDEDARKALTAWNSIAARGKGAYAGFMSTTATEDIAKVFPEKTYARLKEIKKKYDPENIFSLNFNIKI